MKKNNFITNHKRLFLSLLCLVVVLIAIFFVVKAIRLDRNTRPEKTKELPIPASRHLTESSDNHLLGVAVDAGSYWTDGNLSYRVVSVGDTIRMKGTTTHGDSAVINLLVRNDTLRVGFTTSFAAPRCVLSHNVITGADGTSHELLIAYDDSLSRPIAVLERFDGDMMKYGLHSLHAVLEGEFTDKSNSSDTWIFFSDGTVQVPPSYEPRPYEVETYNHRLSNVIRFSDGGRAGLVLIGTELYLYEAKYNTKDHTWYLPVNKLLKSRLQTQRPNLWTDRVLFNATMLPVLDKEYLRKLSHDLMMSNNSLKSLNGFLMLSL